MSSLVMHPNTNPNIYRIYLEIGDTEAAIDISRMFTISGVFRNKSITLNWR
jgi:hypothetical protein